MKRYRCHALLLGAALVAACSGGTVWTRTDEDGDPAEVARRAKACRP